MALVDNRIHRVTMLCAMYFAQGVPWGFMVTALVAYLTGEKGISQAAAGELTAIVLVPWTFKLVWAPLIDTITIRSMGRRRPWIIGAELMMAVSLLGILMLGDLSENLRLLGWMFFIHNCFASLQDVATDALAIDVLPVAEQGRTNGMMWGSKLIGKAVGATVMAQMIYFWGLPAAVLAQFVLLVLIMIFPLLLLERPGEKRFPWSIRPVQPSCPDPDNGQPETPSSLRSPLEVLIDVRRAFSLTTTSVFLVFGTLCTVGWGIVEVITKPLYTQELGWSFLQVSQISGAAVLTEMTGALLGGFLADRIGRRTVMTIGFGLFGLLTACFAAFPEHWDKSWFAGGYLLFYPGALAIGSVGFLSMGMRITWTKAAATIFTIYMTVSNIGHVIGNKLVGPLSDSYDFTYAQSFWFAAVAVGLPLLLLPLVNPERVDQSKDV